MTGTRTGNDGFRHAYLSFVMPDLIGHLVARPGLPVGAGNDGNGAGNDVFRHAYLSFVMPDLIGHLGAQAGLPVGAGNDEKKGRRS